MKQVLIVAATRSEIQPLLDHFITEKPFNVLITGVGMVATAYAIGNQPQLQQYHLIVNLGIAGSFDKTIALGEVVEITYDRLSELGAEDGSGFIPIETLGFGKSIFLPVAAPANLGLRQVSAITVNTVHGNEDSIASIIKTYSPQLESMEGAAFFYACEKAQVPCLQIRAVSNYVEKRNRNNWKIGLAVKNLNNFAIAFIEKMLSKQ